MRKVWARRGAALFLCALLGAGAVGCAPEKERAQWNRLTPVSETALSHARQFSISEYAEGYRLITVADSGRYLVVPQDVPVPEELPGDLVVLQQPLDRIYLTATAVMDLFRSLGSVGAVRLSGTDASGWYIEEAKRALQDGSMLYAGKYNAPDYETILSNGCDLAVESTMIYHTPEVKEQLERLGIPVFVDYSSYETDPLGRMEWIKLYGVLLGREEEAQRIFDDAVASLAPVLEQESTGKTAAFFYITSTGSVNVRKSGDYVAAMIGLAGGRYLPQDLPGSENALSTMNIDMESFYAAAKDADVLIYNSTIDGELRDLDQLLAKSPMLADFKAVRQGTVWGTGKNMFQESMGLGNMILDLHAVFTEENPRDLTYLYRLQ